MTKEANEASPPAGACKEKPGHGKPNPKTKPKQGQRERTEPWLSFCCRCCLSLFFVGPFLVGGGLAVKVFVGFGCCICPFPPSTQGRGTGAQAADRKKSWKLY